MRNLILNLIETRRVATAQELQALTQHVALTLFSSRQLKINHWLQVELTNRGVTIASPIMSSIELHLLKRIYLDQQWPLGTTAAQFMTDLQQAVQHPSCQIWTYRWLNEAFAGFLALSHLQNVPKPEPYIFVAYSADYDRIKTGYQANSIEAVFTDEFQEVTRHR